MSRHSGLTGLHCWETESRIPVGLITSTVRVIVSLRQKIIKRIFDSQKYNLKYYLAAYTGALAANSRALTAIIDNSFLQGLEVLLYVGSFEVFPFIKDKSRKKPVQPFQIISAETW